VSSRLSLEELLARQAVLRIRKWLRERRRGEKQDCSPRLAIKFCGGCNPAIERGAVAKRIREELAKEVSWVSGEEEKDFLLIINGCETACADMPEGERKTPTVVICGEALLP